MNRFLAAAGLLAGGLLLGGCSGSGPAGTVSGTVTKGGQGIAAQIALQSEHATVSGVSDAAGNFKLTNGDSAKIPVGRYRVAVSDVSGEAEMSQADYDAMMTGGKRPPKSEVKIPAKYASFGTSGLEFTVSEGENTFDIPLE